MQLLKVDGKYFKFIIITRETGVKGQGREQPLSQSLFNFRHGMDMGIVIGRTYALINSPNGTFMHNNPI